MSASQQSAAKRAAGTAAFNQNEAAIKQEAAEFTNQENTMRYQDETWQQDIEFATKTLGYQINEFAKQEVYVEQTKDAITKNETAQFGQVALQAIQKNIAITLGEANMNTQAAQARATAQVQGDARGVEGNSVNAIIDDVFRQQGQSASTMEMNRLGVNTQAQEDMAAVKAGADTQLGQLQASVKTYSPSTPIRAPGPVQGVQDITLAKTAEQSSAADTLAIAGAGLSGAVSGFQLGANLTGTTTKDALSGVGKLLGI